MVPRRVNRTGNNRGFPILLSFFFFLFFSFLFFFLNDCESLESIKKFNIMISLQFHTYHGERRHLMRLE